MILYFADSSMYDIAIMFGTSFSSVLPSALFIVNDTNLYLEFQISYPKLLEDQRKTAPSIVVLKL